MEHKDIHKLIEGYYDASLSMSEEDALRKMLSQTEEDSEDIREAKATLGVFATNRKQVGKSANAMKTRTLWGRMKYAAVFAISILFDIFFDFDDAINNKLKR